MDRLALIFKWYIVAVDIGGKEDFCRTTCQ